MSSRSPLRTPRAGRWLVGVLVAIAVLLLVLRGLSHLYVDVLWFDTIGYSDVFWSRTLWEWALRLFVVAAAGAIAYLNLRVVASTLGSIRIRRRFANLEISERLPKSYIRWALLGAAGLFGLWFGAAVPAGTGVRTLIALNAPIWGMQDPIFGHDASFYVFLLPLLSGALALAIALAFLLFAVCLAGYSATGSIRLVRGRPEIGVVPRRHLGVIVAAFLVLLGARFFLARYLLLLDGNSDVQGIFGYADAAARLPALQAMVGISLVAGAVFGWSAIKGRAVATVAAVGVVMLSWVALGQLYPGLVQRFRVEPNELDRESPYIEHNLEFTREGFGLRNLQRKALEYREPEAEDWASATEQLSGLPIWSRSALLTTFREVEAQYPYYDFNDVAIDRYTENGRTDLVAVSVREVNRNGIPDPNWQNVHLRELYVRGMGAVAVEATQRTSEGRPQGLLSEIPPRLTGENKALRLDRPSVFFGTRLQPYAVVNPEPDAFLGPSGTEGVPGVDYPVGITMRSTLRTLSLAWRFRDANLLFAAEVGRDSRFVFRRDVTERLLAVAPFLRFPANPYPVIVEGRVLWMVDGYTESRGFPLSSPHELEPRRPVSYVRNSVKATVDALSGEMHFYVVDVDDPLLQAVSGAFPSLLSPLSEMPEALLSHIRYPAELLRLQSRVLLQYHQETARRFHRQEDVWDIPKELAEETQTVDYRPAYGYYRLPGESEPEFLLSTVFVPVGRQNLRGLLVARCDPERYGDLILYDVASEDLVPGPRQVEARVEQDPSISQQFSLWRQGGSEVWSGHLHLVPVGGSLLYMEPIYLAAEADAIPELQRFIVSDGRRVAMTTTLAGALDALSGTVESERAGSQPSAATVEQRPDDEALRLLDEAERLLREGDFAGFGERLRALRQLLQSRSPPSSG